MAKALCAARRPCCAHSWQRPQSFRVALDLDCETAQVQLKAEKAEGKAEDMVPGCCDSECIPHRQAGVSRTCSGSLAQEDSDDEELEEDEEDDEELDATSLKFMLQRQQVHESLGKPSSLRLVTLGWLMAFRSLKTRHGVPNLI